MLSYDFSSIVDKLWKDISTKDENDPDLLLLVSDERFRNLAFSNAALLGKSGIIRYLKDVISDFDKVMALRGAVNNRHVEVVANLYPECKDSKYFDSKLQKEIDALLADPAAKARFDKAQEIEAQKFEALLVKVGYHKAKAEAFRRAKEQEKSGEVVALAAVEPVSVVDDSVEKPAFATLSPLYKLQQEKEGKKGKEGKEGKNSIKPKNRDPIKTLPQAKRRTIVNRKPGKR